MSDIFYVYGNSAYANLTNKCSCSCDFCIRKNGNALGNAENLWHDTDPKLEEILAALKEFPINNFNELVFCGYGEPTYALDNLISTAKYIKENYNIKIRLNTNGLGNLINNKNIIPLIAPYIDTISISLNAPDPDKYNALCHPAFDGAYNEILNFASSCKDRIDEVILSVVDVIPKEDIDICRKITSDMGLTFRVRGKD